ncbi:hypothetical protein PMAYCL1PPCAC_15935, partial [Pristionchus mayeri]
MKPISTTNVRTLINKRSILCDISSIGQTAPRPTLDINPNPFGHLTIIDSSFPPLVCMYSFTYQKLDSSSSSSSVFYNAPIIRPPSSSPEPKKAH